MKTFFISFFFFISLSAFSQTLVHTQTAQRQLNRQTNITYKIIEAPDKTFGYDIYANKHKIIHQPSVPGLPGSEGFKTKAAAITTAELVVEKMQKGEMLPAITIEEMEKLKVIK